MLPSVENLGQSQNRPLQPHLSQDAKTIRRGAITGLGIKGAQAAEFARVQYDLVSALILGLQFNI